MKNEKINTFLVDGNSLFKNSFEATYKPNESSTQLGGTYLFLVRLRNQLFAGSHNRLRVAFDGNQRGILRRLIYPDYKKSRTTPIKSTNEVKLKKNASFLFQKNKLQEYLNYFAYWYEDIKVEADDVIACYVYNKDPNEKITIATGDVDVMQLIDENVRILYLNKSFKNKTPAVKRYEKTPHRKNLIITHKNFKKFFGYPHENIPLIKTICGDDSDEIKNIKGVRETSLFKVFPQILEGKCTIQQILQECETGLTEDKLKGKRKTVLTNIFERKTDGVQGKRILEINERIVDLSNQEFLSPRCLANIQNNGFLSNNKFKAKDSTEMVAQMQRDGIYGDIIKNHKSLKSFFKPIKKTIQ